MTLNGLDISEYQSTTPPLGGQSFVFARATYDCHPDAKFAQHMSAARMAGIVRGAYHFATGRSSADAQAQAFLTAAGDAHLLAVDFENDSVPASAALVQALIASIKAKDPRHRKVGLYHSESGFPELGQDFDWVAHWGAAFPARHWQFHQYTSDGSLAGYSGRLDLDRFNGDLPALHALAGIAPTYSLHIAANATVMVATLSASGCISAWTSRKWGPKPSSAPCRAPVNKKGCAHGGANVAYVTRGVFSDRWVRVGDGVTVVSQ